MNKKQEKAVRYKIEFLHFTQQEKAKFLQLFNETINSVLSKFEFSTPAESPLLELNAQDEINKHVKEIAENAAIELLSMGNHAVH